MVLTLLIPARSLYQLHDVITWNHIDVMCKIILLTGSMVGYSYFIGIYYLLGGFVGFLTAALLQFIPSSFLYPLIVHGKPVNFFTVPAFFPIMFELTILFSAFTAFFGVFVMNRLPRLHHPLFDYTPFQRVTDDAFFLVIESLDPRFMEVETPEFLEEIGGKEVTLLYEND
jgi:Protein of unknown function (DUF3341)